MVDLFTKMLFFLLIGSCVLLPTGSLPGLCMESWEQRGYHSLHVHIMPYDPNSLKTTWLDLKMNECLYSHVPGQSK